VNNFIAFRFTDNDFHSSLREALEYIVYNATEELTLESWRVHVLRGMVAFNLIRRIDNWYAGQILRDHTEYCNNTLVVSVVAKLADLGDSFEGYVFDKNLQTVFYQGY